MKALISVERIHHREPFCVVDQCYRNEQKHTVETLRECICLYLLCPQVLRVYMRAASSVQISETVQEILYLMYE